MARASRNAATSLSRLTAARDFQSARQRSFDRRWAVFFIAELNGLADQRRLAIEEGDDVRVLAIQGRIRQILGSLAWEPSVALRGAYEFGRDKIGYPEDAWGPALIIGALEKDSSRVAKWLAALPHDTQRELGHLTDVLGETFRQPER